MLVSILIPTLNRRALLERAVASALAQTHRDLEIVVSDDGSTDGSVAYIAGLAEREPRLRLAPKNPRPGLFPNMNHLLAQRRGDFFCVLADDDMLEPEFVAKLLGHLVDRPDCVACFCGMSRVDEQEHFLGLQAADLRSTPGPLDQIVHHVLEMQLLLNNVLYRSLALADLRFDVECLGAAEKDFNLRAHARGLFFYTPEPLVIARVHAAQVSRTQLEYMLLGLVRTLERHRFVKARDERLRLQGLQQARTSYASMFGVKRLDTCLTMMRSYLAEGPRHWRPRALASLTLSAFRATLPSPLQACLQRIRGA